MSNSQAGVDDPSVLDPSPSDAEADFGGDMTDEELGELLVWEITIDGMCGVY